MAEPNYSTSELDYGQRAVIIYGKGKPSHEVTALLDQAPPRANAYWVNVPYSQHDINKAGARLADAIPRYSMIDDTHHYSGIVVGMWHLPTTAQGIRRLHQRAAAATDIPVRFVEWQAVPL
jgi:hypothetical protein